MQINCEINVKAQMINIVDILKPTDDVLANSSTSSTDSRRKRTSSSQDNTGSAKKMSKTVEEDRKKNNKNWAIDNAFKREQIRQRIPDNPQIWSKANVSFWLQWAMRQFNETNINPKDWDINGEQLCKITLEDFSAKVPVDPGNFFWTHLELLRKCKYVAVQQKNGSVPPIAVHNSANRKDKVARVSTAPTAPQAVIVDGQVTKPMKVLGRSGRNPDLLTANRSGNNGQIQLWQFLLDILTDVDHRDVIQWEGYEGQFKLIDPERVAQLWGIRKNKPNMNYEKLSRALRYYYDGDMLAKVPSKRFVYQFVCNLTQLIGYNARELAMLVNGS